MSKNLGPNELRTATAHNAINTLTQMYGGMLAEHLETIVALRTQLEATQAELAKRPPAVVPPVPPAE